VSPTTTTRAWLGGSTCVFEFSSFGESKRVLRYFFDVDVLFWRAFLFLPLGGFPSIHPLSLSRAFSLSLSLFLPVVDLSARSSSAKSHKLTSITVASAASLSARASRIDTAVAAGTTAATSAGSPPSLAHVARLRASPSSRANCGVASVAELNVANCRMPSSGGGGGGRLAGRGIRRLGDGEVAWPAAPPPAPAPPKAAAAEAAAAATLAEGARRLRGDESSSDAEEAEGEDGDISIPSRLFNSETREPKERGEKDDFPLFLFFPLSLLVPIPLPLSKAKQ